MVYCDNVSTIYLSGNLIQHQRTKHIELVFNLSVRRWLAVKSGCYMSFVTLILQIFLLRVYPETYLVSFDTISVSGLLPRQLRGVLVYIL